jgi:hypothetical protein
MRLPEMYIDAKELLVTKLKEDRPIIKGQYDLMLVVPCELEKFEIEEKEDDSFGTIKLKMVYKESGINKYEEFKMTKKEQELHLLSPNNDIIYNHNLIVKLWNGEYPSTVALDFKEEKVYLVYLGRNFKIIEFANLSKDKVSILEEDLFEAKPYKIKLDEKSMFDFISEEEGFNNLRKNIYIQFDCGMKIKIYNNLSEEN